MKIIFSEKSSKISRNKEQLERDLNVKISVRKEEVSIDGKSEDEFVAEQIIEALGFGFPLSVALLIKTEDAFFEILRIKEYTPRSDLERVRARIIGAGGKTLKTLNTLTECYFEIKGNEVGIIGQPELIKNAQDAVIAIIQGSKQANVYSYLEKNKTKPILDLGLKKKIKT